MKIAVVGLGLIGGSIGKALKKYTQHTVLGFDRDKKTIELALSEKGIDREIKADELNEADVVYVCLYPIPTINFILSNKNNFKKGSVVIDVCGVKTPVCSAVKNPLNDAGINYISSHPMAGREFSGFAYSDSDLFVGASFIIVEEENSNFQNGILKVVENLAYEMQFGQIVYSAAEQHDQVIAYTSQLAHIVSSAYIKSPSAKKRYGFSAGSYKDLTRVAKLNEEMWSSLFMLNRKPLINEIDTIINNLTEYKSALENEDEVILKSLLKKGREIKESLD